MLKAEDHVELIDGLRIYTYAMLPLLQQLLIEYLRHDN
jgi:hypothetical protein